MASYTQDTNIPSHGRRAKVDNADTIRIHISRREGMSLMMGENDFDLYLNIIPTEKKYHATVETESGYPPQKQVISVEVPSDALDVMVAISLDKGFMSIKNEDIFPDIMMLDGNDIKISIKSDIGNLSLDSNMLEDTLMDGIIPVEGKDYDTHLHVLAAVAFKVLGIDPHADEIDEDEEEL